MKKIVLIFTLLLTCLIPQNFAVAASSQLIIINTATNKLAFYENGNLVKDFPIATGKSSTPTPQGKFEVVTKIKNRPYYKGGIRGGDPRNPLGDRWLGLNVNGTPGNTYAIHGNNNENSIGNWVSSGCVRMYNADIRWLYERVNMNATVIIKNTHLSDYQIAALYGISLAQKEVKGVMDSPASEVEISGNYNISGWFLDESGVSKIEVLVGGVVVGQASYGVERRDVQQAYPEYNNRYAGYQYTLDTTKFKNGRYSIKIRAIGKNGKVTTLPKQKVKISHVRGVMDSPAQGAKVQGTHKVSGWFLDESGVSQIEVLVDGAVVGYASYGDKRSDVKRAYPEYKNGRAGYHYNLDTTKLSDGNHTITVRETGKDGKVMTLSERTITVSNVIGTIDSPVAGEKLQGRYNVSGWFLDGSGVSKIEVLVDGDVVGQASYGYKRTDVKRAYPQFKNGQAGYRYALDTTKFKNGSHTITVRETGENGQVKVLSERKVTITNDIAAPKAPQVNSFSNQDKIVTGVSEAGAIVAVQVGGKTYKARAKADGTYVVKTGVQKSGLTVRVTATDKVGNVSAVTKVRVTK